MVTPMPRFTLLYATDDRAANESLERKLNLAAYDSVLTASSIQALALLFVNRRINAVLLDQQTKHRPSLMLARAMRSLRPDIPIVLLAPEPIEPLPKCLDACLCAERDLGSLIPMLHMLLTARGDRTLALQH